MKHIIFSQEQASYEIAILIKDSHFNKAELLKHYVEPLSKQGIAPEKIIAFNLPYDRKKVSNKQTKEYLNQLLPVLQKLGVKYIYCADAEYFKTLTKQRKADNQFGYLLPSEFSNYSCAFNVVLGLNYGSLLYNPNQASKLDLSIDTLINAYKGNYQEIGKNISHHEDYPESLTQIEWFLNHLHQYPSLVCDIETFSLNLFDAHLGTIAFAWNKHEGGAFCVDYTIDTTAFAYGTYKENPTVRKLLRNFFIKYKGNIIYHNATYDIKVLILNLFMQHEQDYVGMLYGLDVMTRHIDDTKVIAYLALNTTADLSLGLKDLSHEYAGNYAQDDIKDIRLIPKEDLLRYNLTDCLSTWYVFDKYYPAMLRDNQQNIYETLMKPSLKILIQMELVGMPIDLSRVNEVEKELVAIRTDHLGVFNCSPTVLTYEKRLQLKELAGINSKLKTKQHGLDKVADYKFNPNSNSHLQELLYEVMQLPEIDFTTTKQPATGGKTLEKLINHTDNPEYKKVLSALIGLSKVEKILSSFIPAFKQAKPKQLGSWLHGNFNLNGTVSGRLSSNKPNLQNLPSGSDYGKLIKYCFTPPNGWVFAGADFASLEDRINTLLTKDPNKLSVYTRGFDGHCLRAVYYFNIPNINLNDPKSVNAIKDTHPKERQDSKAPTFALTYQGTWATLMKNCGFSETMAKQIETNYHTLYQVSDQWLQTQLDLCCKQGYIDVAFGLRIRTPLLARSVLNNSKTLREAQAEARSVGNALSGQSYGLLNNRAAIAFMNRVWASEFKYDVFLVSLIHDAIYLIMKDDIRVVEWVNKTLTEEMAWQELPEIQHPQVKLSAELDLFYKGWHQPITIPNQITKEQILNICKTGALKYDEVMH